MGKMSRDKGKRYERELASDLRDLGFHDAHRTAQYMGKTGDAGDVEGVPGIHIEAKHQEQLRIYDWMAQSVRDTEANGQGDLPTVMFRKNDCETLVCMRLADWAELVKAWMQDEGNVKLP